MDQLFKLLKKHIHFHIRNGYLRWEKLGHDLQMLVDENIIIDMAKELLSV